MPNKFCEEMKKARKDQGISYNRLEVMTGISKSYLGEVEKGRYLPSISIGMNIVNALKLDKDLFIRYLFNQEVQRTIDRIKDEAKLYGIDVPSEAVTMDEEYLNSVWKEGFEEGVEVGKREMNMEIRNRIEIILDSE